jgi:pimeloyl-ACP methyl ester carboxylesterase
VELESSKNWKTIQVNKAFTINFSANGTHLINFKITLSNGEIITESIQFNVENQNYNTNKNSDLQFSPNVVNTIASTIPYQGYGETAAFVGQGEYEIFMDTTDGILDKPIFLLDGFDPGDTRNTGVIYNLLNYGTGQNLANDLRAQGFDVIILNFPTYTRPSTTTVIDGGVDYIQRNAMILVELINQINTLKVGNEQNVVIGPSMGGLISRYALRYMEMNSLSHDTRLYISFDAPHLGANVPIGFQHLFNYMAYGPLGNTAVQPIVDGLLKSSAAREMLIDQFEGHLQSGSAFEFNTASSSLVPTGCPNYRTAFQTELNTMGFPLTTRNVSIANGAGNGAMTGMPDMVVMDHTFNITATQRAIINLRFTPLANQTNQVSRFRGQQQIFGFWFTGYESAANSKSPTFTDGLDSAPGGKFDISSLAGATAGNALLTEFFANLNILYFNFIPTLSSMAVSSSTNLYSNVNATSTTPFAAYSIPTINENHITLNAQNTAFALNEILNPVLNNADAEILNSIWIKNPIANSVQINSNYTIENASISIIDILGKNIFNATNQTINGTLEIPLTLSNGVYLMVIKNEKGSITKKIVKN